MGFVREATFVLAAVAVVATSNPSTAQQVASNAAGSPPAAAATLPELEDAGQVAADLCAKRGDTSVNCIRLERNRIVAEIGAQAERDAARARAEADKARERSANADAQMDCALKVKALTPDERAKAMSAADVTKLDRTTVCAVAAKAPERRAD